MKQLTLILLALLLFSCRTPQEIRSSSKQNQETQINNDLLFTNDTHLKVLTDQIIKRLFSERLNIDIQNIKYDTEKPVDSTTGKHPVSEETNVTINRETNVNETDSTHQETDSVAATVVKDNSQITVKMATELKEKTETGLKGWQKGLMFLGGLIPIGCVVFVFSKIKK